MFRKVLIANRGEIAIRINQACRELGLAAAVVYSEADRSALHVRQADEAYCIGPPPVSQSYGNIAALIDAARRAGADALHPGYGFLAEEPALAEACAQAGLGFIGPPPGAMRLLGDKAAAKTLAEQAGVPTIAGYHGADDSALALESAARRLGFPLLVKAAAGGGGRGMRLVRTPAELGEAIHSARREAASAFGSGRLLLERWVERPRHVEVQIIGDRGGQIISLGERDCSLQRRHQKVIEEAPAPGIDPGLRRRLAEAAIRLARAARYVNVGTAEFLLDEAGQFYFLEMNTRLQVEHPVTEAVTGLDLVKLQLLVAAGEPLPLDQDAITLHGHAIECRLYAEDPWRGFVPAAGRVSRFEPPQGAGIRNDVGVQSGDEVGQHYDTLIAKLIVHAENRAAAIARLEGALARYTVEGVLTNLPLLQHLAALPAFRDGSVDTGLAEREWPPAAANREVPPEALLAVAATELGAAGHQANQLGPWAAGPWRPSQRAISLRYLTNGQAIEAEVHRPLAPGEPWVLVRGGQRWAAAVETGGPNQVLLRQENRLQHVSVWRIESGFVADWRGTRWRLDLPSPPEVRPSATRRGDGEIVEALRAPVPGTVVRLAVSEGQRISSRQLLIVLEAMKIEHAITAPCDGLVRRLACREGEVVDRDTVLVEVEAG